MKKLLILLILSSFLYSCNLTKKCPEKISYIEKTKDSISYIVKDSLIILPVDSSLVEMLIKCDSIGNAHLIALNQVTGRRIITKVVIKDNKFKITALEIEIQQKNTIISKYEKSSTNVVKTVVIEKCSSWWHTLYKYGFFILLSIIILFLLWVRFTHTIKI